MKITYCLNYLKHQDYLEKILKNENQKKKKDFEFKRKRTVVVFSMLYVFLKES